MNGFCKRLRLSDEFGDLESRSFSTFLNNLISVACRRRLVSGQDKRVQFNGLKVSGSILGNI